MAGCELLLVAATDIDNALAPGCRGSFVSQDFETDMPAAWNAAVHAVRQAGYRIADNVRGPTAETRSAVLRPLKAGRASDGTGRLLKPADRL